MKFAIVFLVLLGYYSTHVIIKLNFLISQYKMFNFFMKFKVEGRPLEIVTPPPEGIQLYNMKMGLAMSY